ncbi:MAG: outer membrane protein assembly factor BamB [Candidatus Latescibacterota bacterium]|jgi:outer membrane protein assembly factor BamB
MTIWWRSFAILCVSLILSGCSGGVFYAGALPEASAPDPPLTLLWQQKMDAAPLGPAVDAGSLLLQLSARATLYAYDLYSGERVGKRGYDNEVCSAPTVAGDLVMVSTLGEDAAVVAWDRRAQKERWRHEGTFCLETVVRGDTAYVAGESGSLHALDLGSGKELWQQKLEVRLRVAPVVADEQVLLGDGKGMLYALGRFDGEEIWRQDLESGVRTAVLVGEDRLWVGTAAGRIVALEKASGKVLWQVELAALPTKNLALTAGVLAVGTADRHVYGLDLASGQERWRFETQGAVRSSPVAVANAFYCASSDEYLYALEAGTGQLLWKFRLEGPIIESIALVGQNVAVATEKKMLYVFGRR